MITSKENTLNKYVRKVDKSQIPTCNIMGVNIAAINMEWLLEYLDKNIDLLHGDYICVSNVHTTVPCLVDCEQVSPNLIRKSKEQYDFIYPGAATNKDSLEGMLKGLLLLNDDERKKIRFHFTTLRPEKLLEAAKCQNDALEQLKDVLIFHGRMEYSDLLNLYQEMDFLFLARERNIITESNFPSKVPEMLAYGTVPVCSKVGDYTNLYLKNGIDYPHDEHYMLAHYIKKVFDEKETVSEMTRNAQNHARVTHDPDENSSGVMEIYKNIIRNL